MSIEDVAQDVELAQWERVNQFRNTMPTWKPTDSEYGPSTCQAEECGDQMPEFRRALGRHLCTSCQQLLEDRKRH